MAFIAMLNYQMVIYGGEPIKHLGKYSGVGFHWCSFFLSFGGIYSHSEILANAVSQSMSAWNRHEPTISQGFSSGIFHKVFVTAIKHGHWTFSINGGFLKWGYCIPKHLF